MKPLEGHDLVHAMMAPGAHMLSEAATQRGLEAVYARRADIVGHTEMYEAHSRRALQAAAKAHGYTVVQPRNSKGKWSPTAIVVRNDSFPLVDEGYTFAIPARSTNLPGKGIGHAERGLVTATIDVGGSELSFSVWHGVTGYGRHPISDAEYLAQVEAALRVVRRTSRGWDLALLGADPNYLRTDRSDNRPARAFAEAGLVSVFEEAGKPNLRGRRYAEMWTAIRDGRVSVRDVRVHRDTKTHKNPLDHDPSSVWLDIRQLRPNPGS